MSPASGVSAFLHLSFYGFDHRSERRPSNCLASYFALQNEAG